MRTSLVAIALALVATRCTQEATSAPAKQKSAASLSLEEGAPPSGAGAFAPFLSTAKDGVLLSWLEPVPQTDRTAVRVARYRNGRWSSPSTVVARNDLFANWADFPSVIEDTNGILFVHWLQKSGTSTYSYDVRMAVSRDGGTTWGNSFLVNRDGTKTEHGFASLARLPEGGVGVTWLDGRKMKPGDHEHDAGDMTIRYATISDTGAIGDDTELDGRVCECCTTGMAMSPDGPVIMYRDRSDDEIRDISFVRRTKNRWTNPQALHRDGWKIAGCPVNGPQIDSLGSSSAVAWFTAADERQRVYVSFSENSGASFQQPIRVDNGKPAGRVDVVMLETSTALVVWLEQAASGAEIRGRIVKRDGSHADSIRIASSSTGRGAGFPRIARVGGDVWFAWTEQTANSKQIRLARGRFPR